MPRSSVTEIAAAKQQLRAEMRQKRQAMFPMEKKLLESRACKRFLESAEYRRCGQLFCFVSLPQEPDTLPILQQALKDGSTARPLPSPAACRSAAWRFICSRRSVPWRNS